MSRLVLASASPRRRELLSALTQDFDVAAADIDEALPAPVSARDAVRLLAERKANAVLERLPDRLVLAADTLVCLGDRIFGKPADVAAAREFLRSLQGRSHNVLTGVCLSARGLHETRVVATRVVMRALSDEEIEASVAAGTPFDKAGAYAIQDPDLKPVESSSGCYCNVMGLPLWDVWQMVGRYGLPSDLRRPDETRPDCLDCPRRP